MANLLQFGFDMNGPMGVKLLYTKSICYNFELLCYYEFIDVSHITASL
jgi:hypothetical protein